MDNDIEKKWLISCRDAGLGYENKAVLEHLNIEILEGQYICVIGENGSELSGGERQQLRSKRRRRIVRTARKRERRSIRILEFIK